MGGFDADDFGVGMMLIACNAVTASANDDCEDRQTINEGEVTPWTLVGATLDGPSTTCNSFVDSERDVWFNYTATCAGGVNITFRVLPLVPARIFAFPIWGCTSWIM